MKTGGARLGRRRRIAGIACLALGLCASVGAGQGTVTGNCWIEKVKGRPGDYLALYEWNIFSVGDGDGATGQSYRVGLPPNSPGYYTFTAAPGTYSMLLDQVLFWGRPKVVTNVSIPASGTVLQDVELPTDYSCAFGENGSAWGESPWTPFDSPWHQTFVATGTSVSGVSFKLAGTNTSNVTVSIHQDNGGNVTTWPQVGVARTVHDVGTMNDNWLRWRSGEIPTVPGRRYALKLTGIAGGGDGKFAVFCRSEDGSGYARGQAFNSSGAARGYDLYAVILSDNDQTRIPYCSVEHDEGDLAGWAGVWAQQIRAKGISLAGADLFFAADTWDTFIAFRVRIGGSNGPQVGPTKYGRGAYQAANSGHVAASWNRGEIPLTPGQIYFLEVSSTPGLNPVKFAKSSNAYPDGEAFMSYKRQSGVDLLMQVVEYDGEATGPVIDRGPASFDRTLDQGDSLPSDTFTIGNSGTGTLIYSIDDDAEWLQVDPASGTSSGETDTISILYSSASLAAGTYTGTITISSVNAANSPQTVFVTLRVQAAPDLDRDGDVDLSDFGLFQLCFSGPNRPPGSNCLVDADFDADTDVDLSDFGVLQRCFNGPNRPPACP